MRRPRHAKIIATLGPSSSSKKVIGDLHAEGADVFRLNFSHGNFSDHAARHRRIREVEEETGSTIAIMQDLQGPKIRVGLLNGGGTTLIAGTSVRFVLDETADLHDIPLPHPAVFKAIQPNHEVLIDDGRLRLRVERRAANHFEAVVEVGGRLSNSKGVNLPSTPLPVTSLTAKDRKDLEEGLRLGVDWVALSFVQRPEDLDEARALIGSRAWLMAKLEKPSALEQIDEIVARADGVMVARGDLGVETPPEDIPWRQKELVAVCRRAGKPVVVATQMLESMVNVPVPTRAEATDVATAIYDGADAVMLSAETASGRYPKEAVKTMNRIVASTERHVDSTVERPKAFSGHPHVTVSEAISQAAVVVAHEAQSSAIVSFTTKGATTLSLAACRPKQSVLSLSPDSDVARRLCLVWGCLSVRSPAISSFEEMAEDARKQVLEAQLAKSGDTVVAVAGVPFGVSGSTNNIRVLEIENDAQTPPQDNQR